MQILTSLSEDKLRIFSEISKHSFISLNKTAKTNEKQCAVIMEGEGFANDLELAFSLHIPTIVISGKNNEKGQIYAQKAKSLGISDDAIFFKQDRQVISLSGKSYEDGSRGIKVETIVELCSMAIQNNLTPEVLFWEEGEQVAVIWEESPESTRPVQKTDNPPKAKRETGFVQTEGDLINVLGLGEKIITVFKTTKDSNSSKVAKDLAAKLHALHLEVNNEPHSFTLHGKTIEDAIHSGHYAYSNGKSVSLNNRYSGGKYIILEIDPCELTIVPDAMNFAYEKAHKIIHVLKSLENGKIDIDKWIEAKFTLDYIIPEDEDAYAELKGVYGNLVCNINEVVKRIG